ncbi:MAG: hypothetical protein KDI31_08145 [Pseudomonadales bacterium]|nr:hypothetical protein [Pseudomonadales bacterium]
MTDRNLWPFAALAQVLFIAGCGGVSGEYGGEECLYDKLDFQDGGTAYITFVGMETPASYRMDGDRVILTAQNGQAVVFTRNGGNLEASLLGETMVCSPL